MKRDHIQKGKTFYAILRLLVVCITVPILIALLLTQRTLERSHEALQSVLGVTLETQVDTIQQANPGRNHMEQLSQLRAHPLLEQLGQASQLEYGPDIRQAEDILLRVTPASENGQITTYLYFPASGYLIDGSRPGENAASAAEPFLFHGLDGNDTDVPRAFLYTDPRSGDAHTIYTAAVFPGVVFLFDIYFPEYPVSSRDDMKLSSSFTAGLTGVETYYYDSYGNVRLTGGSGSLAQLYDYHTLGPEENGSFTFRHNGHFYLCRYVFNEYSMTKFALFCRDEIAEEQHRTSILLWTAGGVLLAVFLLWAFVYTRRTYRPIGSLLKRVTPREEGARPHQDEFDVLNQALDSLDDQLNQRDRLLRKYYLLRVLRGQKAGALEDYQDEWFSGEIGWAFAVAALHVDEFQGGELYDEVRLDSAVTAFLREEGRDVRTVSDGDFLYIVLRLPRSVRDDELLALFRRLQSHLKEYCISVYLSEIHPGIRQLRRCYNEAMAVSEYYVSHEQIGIIADRAATPQAGRTGGAASPDFSQLRKLSDCITALSGEDALRAFDELTSQFVQASGQPLTAESPLYSLLVNTIALAVYDIDLPTAAGKAEAQRQVGLIRSAESAAQLRCRLEDCLQELNRKADGQEESLQRFDKLRSYIQAHYSDPNLDSASIAEHYHMSPSAITRLFKKYNHTGFLEYVHQTRVEKATELLQTTDLPISEISALVGYTNAATMSRAFKAHANSTPSMVRRRAQKS